MARRKKDAEPKVIYRGIEILPIQGKRSALSKKIWKALREESAKLSPNPDDAPELDEEFFRRADIYKAGKLIRRGKKV